MAERYCGTKLVSDEMDMLLKSMEILMKLSEKDQGSDETLRFGSMLIAEKIVE